MCAHHPHLRHTLLIQVRFDKYLISRDGENSHFGNFLLMCMYFLCKCVATSHFTSRRNYSASPADMGSSSTSPSPNSERDYIPVAASPIDLLRDESSSPTPSVITAGSLEERAQPPETSERATPSSSKKSTTGPNPFAEGLKPRCNCEKLAHVECHLENKDLWDKFNDLGTEMIITKTGR